MSWIFKPYKTVTSTHSLFFGINGFSRVSVRENDASRSDAGPPGAQTTAWPKSNFFQPLYINTESSLWRHILKALRAKRAPSRGPSSSFTRPTNRFPYTTTKDLIRRVRESPRHLRDKFPVNAFRPGLIEFGISFDWRFAMVIQDCVTLFWWIKASYGSLMGLGHSWFFTASRRDSARKVKAGYDSIRMNSVRKFIGAIWELMGRLPDTKLNLSSS